MRRTGYGFIIAAVLAFGVPVLAQKPAGAPANATAQCTDGTFSTAKTETGACSKHGGVKTWFGGTASAAAAKGETKKEAASTSKKEASKETAATGAPKASASGGAPPAGATGQCTDGSFTKAKTQTGACSNHGGVKTWFAADTASKAPAATPKNAAPAAASKSAPAATGTPAAPAPAPAATPKSAPAGNAPAASSKAESVARPAGAPADATGKCKDGTFTTSKTHTGACSHHGGVAEWFK